MPPLEAGIFKSLWKGLSGRGSACLLAVSVSGMTSPVAPNDLLPDLVMAEPQRLEMIVAGNGLQMLRFGTIVWNVGDGPLEIRANQRVGRIMEHIEQRVRTSDGNDHSYVPTGASIFYSGDGHNHWHVQDFLVVTLYPVPGSAIPATNATRELRKIGYCLEDTHRMPEDIKPASAVARADYIWCGDRSSLAVTEGISVGYGDEYAWWLRHQSVPVDGLPSGTYRLCLSVNISGVWLEKDSKISNNFYWLDLALDVRGRKVTVVDEAAETCGPPPRLPSA